MDVSKLGKDHMRGLLIAISLQMFFFGEEQFALMLARNLYPFIYLLRYLLRFAETISSL